MARLKRAAVALILIVIAVVSVIVAVTAFWKAPASTPITSPTKTITVPDDFSTIQAAVDHAQAGDTIFVRNGIYNEAITITKSLTITGEDPAKTVIIRHQSDQTYLQPAIEVDLGNFTISGFTIRDSQTGIYVQAHSERGKVVSCNLLNNTYGIGVGGTLNFIKDIGEYVPRGPTVSIYGNYIAENQFGLSSNYNNITIFDNTITNNKEALFFWGATCKLYENVISNNQEFGIEFAPGCTGCEVHDNDIERNGIGIQLNRFPISETYTIGTDNVVYGNNFIDNAQQACEVLEYDFNSPSNGTDMVAWDDGEKGNYWSDYQTMNPSAKEIDAAGIGDRPYVIDSSNIDHYPLTKPASLSIPEFPSLIILPLSMIATLLIAGVYFKKRKHQTEQQSEILSGKLD